MDTRTQAEHTSVGRNLSTQLATGSSAALRVSNPTDPAEREARGIAQRLAVDQPVVPTGEPRGNGLSRSAGPGTAGGQVTGDPTPCGPGTPLPASTLAWAQPAFGTALDRVRVHTGPDADDAARRVSAEAFTVGSRITFGTNKFSPETPQGRELLTHELAHVIQQTGSDSEPRATSPIGVARQELSIEDFDPPDAEVTDSAKSRAPVDPLAESDDVGSVEEPFTSQLSRTDPSIILVPVTATRVVIARHLGVAANAFLPVGALEASPPSEDLQGIRFVEPSAIPAPLMARMRVALEAMLGPDVNATVRELIAETGGWAAAGYVLRWLRYAGYPDAGGRSYFDRYLDALDARTIVTTTDYWVTESKSKRTGVEELLAQTSGDVHASILRARSRSGRAKADDKRFSAYAPLPLGHVVGRWISGQDAATVSIQVATVLVSDITDRDLAEVRLRNASFIGGKALIQSKTGSWYGYGVLFGASLGDIIPPVVGGSKEKGQFSWYYPATMFIGQGEQDPNGAADEKPEAAALRQQLLSTALAGTDNRAIISLDISTLKLASAEQRLTIFRQIVGAGFSATEGRGYTVDLAVQALARTLMTISPTEFNEFARRLDEAGITQRLLSTKDSRLAPLGAAFTYQVMASATLAEGTFADPVELVQGTKSISSGLNYYLADVRKPTKTGDGTMVAFEHGYSTTAWGDTPAWSLRSREMTKAMRPTDMVSVETIGPAGTHRRFASAFEAALTQGDPKSQVEHESMMDFLNVLLLFQAGAGLLRLGSIGLRAMATSNLRAAIRVLSTELATEAGKRAARSIVDFALFSASRYVAEHSEELDKTPQGRAFSAAVTAAIALLAIRDLGTLVESGMIERLVLTGRNALGVLSESARLAVQRTVQNFQATRLAWGALKAEGKVLVTNVGGITVRRPASLADLNAAYRVSQAQVAGENMLATLGKGGVAEQAGRTMGKLERAAGGLGEKAGTSQRTAAELETAKAYRDVARHVTAIAPGKRQGFLDALDRLLATKGRTVGELAPFIRASVGKAGGGNAIAYLDAAGWLGRSGISKAGFARLAENALGKSPANLEWLSTTKLTPDDLDFLARDPHTPWKTFADSAAAPGQVDLLRRAMRGARGHAAEIVARDEALAGRLVPGFRVEARQVTAGTSEIDFQLISTDRLGRRRPLEVKGWTQPTWRRSLDAYKRDPTATKLTDAMDIAGSKSVAKMMRQLSDASSITTKGELPVLAVSADLARADRAALEALVAGKAEVVYLPESQITSISGRLRTGMGIK